MPRSRKCPNCAQEIVHASIDAVRGIDICPLCGTPLGGEEEEAPAPVREGLLPQGFMVAGFRIEHALGRGGMGTVYLATQLNLARPVALKTLSQQLSTDSAFVERFFREARAAASLSHPNIVQAFDAGATQDGIFYFAMELIEGETLEKRIAKCGRIPVRDALDIASKISDALNHAWQRQKLCHGDIKPENIIIDSSTGVVKLADLGLAKSMHDDSRGEGDLMATPLYAPPEIIRGERDRIGAQSDMYSFGATLYHMLYGRPPFPGDDPNAVMDRQLHEKPEPLSELVSDVGPNLSAFVSKLLEKSPEKRPASWAEVAETLKKPLDPEHKVLRMYSTNKSISSPSLDRQSPGFELRSPQELRSEGSFISRNLPLILIGAFLFVAAVGMGSLFAIKSHQAKLAAQAAARKEAEAPKPAELEWATLKSSLASMRAEQAADALQWYLDKHKDSSVREAIDYMAELKERITEPFRKSLAALNLIAADKAFLSKPVEELKRVDAQAANVFSQAAATPYLAELLSPQERASFERLRASIKVELAKRQADGDAQRKAELERKNREREEAELKRKQEDQRRAAEAQAAAARNAAIDAFSDIVSSKLPLQDRSESTRKDFLDALSSFKGALPSNYSISLALMKKAAAMQTAFPDIFIDRFDQALKGQPVPDEAFAGFVADSADSKAVKLIQEEGKVKIGKKLLWTQLKPDASDALLRDRILSKPELLKGVPLPLQESLLADMLLYGKPDLFNAALDASSLKPQEKAPWKECSSLAFSAKREAEALALWREAQALIAKGSYPDAVASLSELSSSYADTLCFERHSGMAKGFIAKYRSLSPAFQAKDLHERAKAALAKGDLNNALRLASSAALRFGFLSSLDSALRSRILETRDAAIAAQKEATQVKAVSDTKLPFFYWEREVPGEAWQYKGVVASANIFKADNPVFAAMSFSAGLDAGIWDDLSGELRNAPPRIDALSRASGAVRNWAPSILFGLSMGADRLQSSELKASLAANLKSSMASLEGPMRRLACALAIEQGFLFRDFKSAAASAAASDALAQPNSPKEPSLDFRISLLKILSALQAQDLKPDALKALVDAVSKENAQSPQFNADLQACRLALALVSQQGPAPSPKDFQDFKDAKPAYPDLCARILADAFAKASFAGSRRGIEPSVAIPALESKVYPSIAASELWERVFALKLASAQSPQELLQVVDAALDDCRICASPFYTRLLLLRASSLLASKQSAQPGASAYFAAFALGCPQLSLAEARFDAVSSPSSALESISSLLASGEGKEAFWLGMASALANYGNGAHSAALKKALLDAPSLTWEERLLLKSQLR